MILICGLGNPGDKYKNTPHNVGFMTMDVLRDKLELAEWKTSDKFFGEISEGNLDKEKVILLKPNTFMNLSGKSINSLALFYKILAENIIVVSDEAQLSLGQIRLGKGGSSGGHNGLKSTIECLGSREFVRVRVGIGQDTTNQDPMDLVLKQLTKSNFKLLSDSVEKASSAIEFLVKSGFDLEKTQNEFN